MSAGADKGGYGCVIVMAAVVGLMIFYSLVLIFT
jgi:hypothetical protein